MKYLCGDKNFNEERVRNGSKKLAKARSGTTQGRLDTFFKVLQSPNAGQKRKVSLSLLFIYCPTTSQCLIIFHSLLSLKITKRQLLTNVAKREVASEEDQSDAPKKINSLNRK